MRCCSPVPPGSSGWSCWRATSSAPSAASSCSCAPKSDGAARGRLEAVLANLFGHRAGRYAEGSGRRRRADRAAVSAFDQGRWERLAGAGDRRSSTAPPRCRSRCRSRRPARSTSRAPAGCSTWPRAAASCAASNATPTSRPRTSPATHAGRFCEGDLDLGQAFRNSYEQSKFEAEQLVRARGGRTRFRSRSCVRASWSAIATAAGRRPSTSSTGRCGRSREGLFQAVPASPSAPVDVVSIDYVADAIHEFCERPGDSGADLPPDRRLEREHDGRDRSIASGYFRRPGRDLVTPAEFASLAAREDGDDALEEGSAYFPYFSVAVTFDDAFTRARLEPAGICASPLGEYLESAARLRHPRPVGQAPDRPGRDTGRVLGAAFGGVRGAGRPHPAEPLPGCSRPVNRWRGRFPASRAASRAGGRMLPRGEAESCTGAGCACANAANLPGRGGTVRSRGRVRLRGRARSASGGRAITGRTEIKSPPTLHGRRAKRDPSPPGGLNRLACCRRSGPRASSTQWSC